jgi:histidine triad (HIT) family protein
MDCIFCKLLDGSLPSWRLYEHEATVAFLDKAQVTPGHTLVALRRHAEDIWALSEDEAKTVMQSCTEWHVCFAQNSICSA